MAYTIKNIISSDRVPSWGNAQKYIAIHYLGVDGQNNNLEADGCGAHFYIYWDGTIYQRCSLDAVVWAVGTAGYYTQKHPEARNANTISIELCCHCDGDKTSAEDKKWWFTEETQKAAVWLVQKLMNDLRIPISNVLRHYDIVNKTCPAPYVHNNRYRTSWTWQEFLSAVSGKEVHWYRVRKTWADEKSQLGAYKILDNAKKNCPVGYSVYDDAGKAVYTPVDGVSGAQPSKSPAGVPASKEAYIEGVGAICKQLMQGTGILASVVTAQCCLETGFGLASDCRSLMDVSNLLGMKCDLINNTWSQWSTWQGKSITKVTPEYYGGKIAYITDRFRAYDNWEQCVRDYEMFLLHVRNNKGYKYSSVQGMTDPAAVIRKIRIGTGTVDHPEGYCTDPSYEGKILNLIKQYNLTRFDTKTVEDRYKVSHDLNDDKHRLGLFHDLNNAKSLANLNWGYKVFDIVTGQLVYEPKLLISQKFAAEMVYMDLLMKDDIQAKKLWDYRNKNTSSFSKTFDEARKNNNRHTNCVSGVQWALLRAGVPRSAIQWYGSKGIVWVGKDAEKNARKYFDIVDGKDKTVNKAIKDGTLQPCDIVTYKTLSHTNAYIVGEMWFDSGHAFCSGTGEGAKFKSWTGTTPYGKYKIAKILRLKV